MSISPNIVYDKITLSNIATDLWSIQGPLSGELVAGLITGLNVLLDDMVKNFNGKYAYLRAVITGPIDINVTFMDYETTQTYETVAEALSNFARWRAAKVDIVTRTTMVKPALNTWGWWIKDIATPDRYQLYQFTTPDFVQGFISICNAFNVDFRDYIFGSPYRYYDYLQPPIYYDIEGYDIEPIPEIKREAAAAPFYTGVYEVDPNVHDYM